MKFVPPSVKNTAFNCVHCGALAKQFWYSLSVEKLPNERPLPKLVTADLLDNLNLEKVEDPDTRRRIEQWANKLTQGCPAFRSAEDGYYKFRKLDNIFVSECFNCDDVSIWISDKIVYPQRGEAPPANPDLPKDIRRDYDEASAIIDLSPRGAAALMRLAIQKLCKEVGESGENINDDIKALVVNGLDSRIQKALDAVRVIGNNAVHPGQIDLRDDRPTAEILFGLINLIAEKLISEPKHIDEVYAALPESALKAIEKRDAK